MSTASAVLIEARASAHLSIRELAHAAQVSPSTVHRIERGRLEPTVAMLARLVAATGERLDVRSVTDPSTLAGLARAISADVDADPDDIATPVRRSAELASRFLRAATPGVEPLLTPPPPTGDRRWDAFLAALAEWLAVRVSLPAPAWVDEPDRFLDRAWWVTPMRSLRASEYAGSPVSFQRHGVYIHRASLVNV